VILPEELSNLGVVLRLETLWNHREHNDQSRGPAHS
jgi:hypothetical protein